MTTIVKPNNPDKEGVASFEISGSTSLTITVIKVYTKLLDGRNGNEVEPSSGDTSHVRFIVDEIMTGLHVTVNYHKQPTDTTRGDFEQLQHRLIES